MSNEPKTYVYLCAGCGIGERVNLDALAQTLIGEFKPAGCAAHPCLCGPEGIAKIKGDLKMAEGARGEGAGDTGNGAAAKVVIGACSERAMTEVFDFGPDCVVARGNLREQMAWRCAADEDAEDTTMLAADIMRMAIVKAQKARLPEPFIGSISNSSVLVVGGGVAGMSAALECARAGYEAILVEKAPALGGYSGLCRHEPPRAAPYRDLAEPAAKALIEEIRREPRVKVFTSAEIVKITGQPGMFDVTLQQSSRDSASVETGPSELRIGAIIVATGARPYEAAKLGHLGYGASPDVITHAQLEKMAREGRIVRPSDGRPPRRVAFIQCAGSRDPNHLPYCSSECCMTSLKQALYVRAQNPDAQVYVLYRDMRTPGQYEDFYRRAQEDEGVFLTKGDVTAVAPDGNGALAIDLKHTLLGEDIRIRADLVVLATGMVPSALLEEAGKDLKDEKDQKDTGATAPKDAAAPAASSTQSTPSTASTTATAAPAAAPSGPARCDSNILHLDYRQGPDMPVDKYGFPNSNFICFPYETRRTGIYACGTVRQPMDPAAAMADAAGAALKAIQAIEMTSQGRAVHPRAGDLSFPDIDFKRCTQCKRCTEECPFGALNEDAKGTPEPNYNRCRRCGICMGACPERIINFANYNIDMIGSMIKAVEVPDEFEEKPRVLVLVCENDAYPAFDIAGLNRLSYSPHVRIIPVRCLGSINVVWIKDALARGYDGILMIGCKHGDDYQCHFIKGSELMEKRSENIQEALTSLALESDRVRLEQLALTDYDRIPALIGEFMETIESVGFNPFKGM